jgi:16S rRNA processing protein RimM
VDPTSQSLAVGTVVRPRGIRGEVVVRGEPEELDLIAVAKRMFLRDDTGRRGVRVLKQGSVRGGLSFHFEGINDRNQAEALRGAVVEIEIDAVAEPTSERYLWFQIEGFEVVTTDGKRLGQIADRIRTGTHDVWVVGDGDREVLIPASPNVVTSMDATARRVVIEVLPGLLELNDEA